MRGKQGGVFKVIPYKAVGFLLVSTLPRRSLLPASSPTQDLSQSFSSASKAQHLGMGKALEFLRDVWGLEGGVSLKGTEIRTPLI